jgi:hypothetical protein
MRKRIWIVTIMLLGCAQVFAWNSAQGAKMTREFTKITFEQPVRAMNVWLLGSYIIEHDTERMARGEQCTRIFRAGDQTTPVVAFHCEHLDRAAVAKNTVVLRRTRVAPAEYELSEFQFADSTVGHGLPHTR